MDHGILWAPVTRNGATLMSCRTWWTKYDDAGPIQKKCGARDLSAALDCRVIMGNPAL